MTNDKVQQDMNKLQYFIEQTWDLASANNDECEDEIVEQIDEDQFEITFIFNGNGNGNIDSLGFDTQCITDTRLSVVARLIMVYLSTKNEDWIYDEYEIMNALNIDDDEYDASACELRDYGYIYRDPKDHNHFFINFVPDIN